MSLNTSTINTTIIQTDVLNIDSNILKQLDDNNLYLNSDILIGNSQDSLQQIQPYKITDDNIIIIESLKTNTIETIFSEGKKFLKIIGKYQVTDLGVTR
mgnify:CR=1 FL=1